MITIYRQSWDASMHACGTLCAEGALILLACKGFAACIGEGWCPDPSLGSCESDTDAERQALADLPEAFEAPNFDSVTRCELFRAYTALHESANRLRHSCELSTILHGLAHYADQKREAMRLRLDGQIANAMKIETRCDRIYATLPAWVQW